MSVTTILDASALLAYLQGETGAEQVSQALIQSTAISAVNWAETLSKLAERGQNPYTVAKQLTEGGLLGNALLIYPVDENLALKIAELRPLTYSNGLSLGDRACIALGLQLNLPVLTTDKAWENLDLDIEIKLIR